MSYSFERVSKAYLKDISKLYKECFNLKVKVPQLIKKYETSIFGKSYTGFVALDENKEVGAYYGVFPCIVRYNGEDLLVGQSGDTMTGINHRKKGLFTSLAKETYLLAEENKMSFVFGFPNENSLPGFERKLGWEFYGSMQMFTINKSTFFPFCELASKFNSLRPIYQLFLSKRLNKLKITQNEINLVSDYSLLRDNRFYAYKLQNSEDINFVEINGFKLVIKADPHLMIGDVEVFDKERISEFTQAIKQLLKRVKAKKAQIIISPNHWLYSILSQEITPSPSLPIGFYKIDKKIDCSKISFSLLDYDTF